MIWNQDWDEIDESDSKEAAGTRRRNLSGRSEYQNLIFPSEQERLYLKEYDGNEIKVEVSGKR